MCWYHTLKVGPFFYKNYGKVFNTHWECKEPFEIIIRDINLKAGAGFVVAITGKIMTMPGLPKNPAAENIDIDEDEKIVGIF